MLRANTSKVCVCGTSPIYYRLRRRNSGSLHF